jgi:nitrous oxide reductase accessory protein NosL
MKKFNLSILLFIFVGLFIVGCEKKEVGGVAKVHWDRDMCERCKMAISERKFAFEIINPKNDKSYKFDDIGCGILWLDEEKIPWKDSAIFWITDAKDGHWINARTAYYTDESITPMAYGLAAYSKENRPKQTNFLSFEDAKKIVYKVEEFNIQKVKELGKNK